MRHFPAFIYLFFTLNAFGQNITKLDSTIWHCSYSQALEVAKQKDLPILIVFSGSDWCKPCIKLREQILVKPEFSKWASENVVCVTADFPKQKKNALSPIQQKQNDALAERFNPKGVFPLVVVLSSQEKVLGYKTFEEVSPEQFIRELTTIMEQK